MFVLSDVLPLLLGPRGSLVEGPGAVLYGMTQFGGPSLGGTVFALALGG